MTRAVFFDRDGIVNRRRPDDYVTRWEEFVLLPDFPPALARVHAMGFLAVLITNQRGVALGRMSLPEVSAIHERMQNALRAAVGSAFDGIEVCPHGDDDRCDCRKPLPGMLLRAAAAREIALAKSWMIGDAERDVVAGNRAGCRTILVDDGKNPTLATIQCSSLAEAVDYIERAAGKARPG